MIHENFPEDFSSRSAELEALSLDELRSIRQRLGVLLHEALSGSQLKVCFSSSHAPGGDADACARNDGSSGYLVGGMARYSRRFQSSHFPFSGSDREAANTIFRVLEHAGISDCSLQIGTHGDMSSVKTEKVSLFMARKDHDAYVSRDIHLRSALPFGSEEHRRALSEMSNIMLLDAALRHVDPGKVRDDLLELLRTKEAPDEFLTFAEEIEQANHSFWKTLLPYLKAYLGGGRITLGESFTCGLLTKLMTSLPGADDVLDFALYWYDPRLKQYVGTPERSTEEDLIAEPSTIVEATGGLLRCSGPETKLSIGTTGWANRSGENEADFFSVGVSELDPDGTMKSRAGKVVVSASRGKGRSRGRRELTRHLGVSFALYQLALLCLNASGQGDGRAELELLTGELEETLKRYAVLPESLSV